MRVLIVNPLHPEIKVDRPTLGIAYLAASLSQLDNIDVKIFDLAVEHMTTKEFVSQALEYDPQMIGFSMLTTTATITKELACSLKSVLPESLYVVGGPHPSADVNDAMANAIFDVAVVGEGEHVIKELAMHIIAGNTDFHKIDGVCVRKSGGEIIERPPSQRITDLDSLAFPSRHLLPIDKYTYKIDGIRATRICTSRGCPLGCIYCDQSVFGQTTRFRSAGNVIDEIKQVYKEGFKAFDIIDDTFTLSRDRVANICEEIIQSRLDVVWRCLGRVDQVDEELLHLMKSAGCRQIYYGVESGSQQTLDRLGKRTTVDQIYAAVRATKNAGMRVKAFFMIGLPWETGFDIEKTLSLAENLPVDGGKFSLPKPLPNTTLLSLLKKGQRLISTDSETLAYYIDDNDQIFDYDSITHPQVLSYLQKARSMRKGIYNG